MQAQPSAENTFDGLEEMVARIDEAVRQPSVELIASHLEKHLCELARSGCVHLPPDFCVTCEGHYARRLLYRSPDLGYVVVAMVWGPGQGTALHDHSGSWCVEGVWSGGIEVTQYELLEDDGGRCRFEARTNVHAGLGSAGSLIPPYEYHTIRNPAEQANAITLHVYGHEMRQCSIFEPLGNGWYDRKTRNLSYDS